MKKIISILTISIILSLVIKWDCIQGKSITVGQTMVSALNSAGANVFSTSINAIGKIDGELGKREIECLIESVVKDFGLYKDSLDISKDYSDNLLQILARGQDSEGSIVTIKIDSDLSKNSAKENTLMIEIFHDGTFDIEKTDRKIRELYLKLKSEPHINTCMVGTIDEKLSEEKGAKIEKIVLNNFGAHLVKGTGWGGKSYIYAYSPIVNNSARIGREEVNINFAYRYSSEENKTYMWIATPIITTE
jgi:hypothetical protein